MSLKMIPTYSDLAGNEVRFLSLDQSKGAFPGFTHRVIVNRRSVGFLAQTHKPSLKAAEFFLAKEAARTTT